jgi:tetratricopeptide (TPR) repeat protein
MPIRRSIDGAKQMTSKQVLLQRAEEQFLKKNYQNALKIYGLILKDYPQLKEAEVGAYLSDMGLENGDDAQALFDYYQAIKRSEKDADVVIDKLMQAIRSTRVIVQQLFDSVSQSHEPEGGIGYEDFLSSVESKGSFAQAFEDMMFSTKVVIQTKAEFIDFITRLVEAGYYEMAAGYLDAVAGDPRVDQDLYALYALLPEGH